MHSIAAKEMVMNSRTVRLIAAICIAECFVFAQDAQRLLTIPTVNWKAPAKFYVARSGGRISGAVTDSVTIAATGTTVPLQFISIRPCRLVDTRASSGFTGAFGPPALSANVIRTIPVPSQTACGVPPSAAYSLSFTVLPSGPLNFLAAFPDAFQNGSVLTSPEGAVVSNAAVVSATADGSIKVMASSATDLIIDINGYYVPAVTLNRFATTFDNV